MWDKILIKAIKPYRKDHQSKVKDRIQVTLDMPMEMYSTFRKQIEAPLANLQRRTSDNEEDTTKNLSIYKQISQKSKAAPPS